MRIRLWKGFHSPALLGLLEQSWAKDDLLILCPPFLKNMDFLEQLPAGTIELCGEWGPSEERAELSLCRRADAAPSYPTSPVLGVFTTGTVSGTPRLVLYSKRNIESSLEAILAVFDRSQIREVFCYPQPFHTFGLILGYMLPLLHGLEVTTGSGRYTTGFHELRTSCKVSELLTLGTPTHFYDLIQYVRKNGVVLQPTYSSIIGGAKVSAKLWCEVRDTLNIQMPSIGYGATEASPGIAHHPPGQMPIEDGEIGYALPHLEVGLYAGRGIEFSGSSMCLAIIQGGEIKFPKSVVITDDIRRRADGMLVYHGRTELILNRGGRKYSLEFMEELVRRELDVEVVCVSLPDHRYGEDLGVLVRSETERAAVHRVLCQEFGSKFELSKFIGVSEFPVGDNAKVDRKTGADLCLRRLVRGEA